MKPLLALIVLLFMQTASAQTLPGPLGDLLKRDFDTALADVEGYVADKSIKDDDLRVLCFRSIAAKRTTYSPRFNGKVDGLLSAAVVAYAEAERIKAALAVDVTIECQALVGQKIIQAIISAEESIVPGQIAPLLRIPLLPRITP
jgi:hypothetical protein